MNVVNVVFFVTLCSYHTWSYGSWHGVTTGVATLWAIIQYKIKVWKRYHTQTHFPFFRWVSCGHISTTQSKYKDWKICLSHNYNYCGRNIINSAIYRSWSILSSDENVWYSSDTLIVYWITADANRATPSVIESPVNIRTVSSRSNRVNMFLCVLFLHKEPQQNRYKMK